jgi:hypothetical protein
MTKPVPAPAGTSVAPKSWSRASCFCVSATTPPRVRSTRGATSGNVPASCGEPGTDGLDRGDVAAAVGAELPLWLVPTEQAPAGERQDSEEDDGDSSHGVFPVAS